MKYKVGTGIIDSIGNTWEITSSDKDTDSYYLETGTRRICKTEKDLEESIKHGRLCLAKVTNSIKMSGNIGYKVGDRFKNSLGSVWEITQNVLDDYLLQSGAESVIWDGKAISNHITSGHMTQIKSDDKEFLCSHEEASNETNSKTQKKDTIKPEVHNDEKVDGDKAMHILRSMCKGG